MYKNRDNLSNNMQLVFIIKTQFFPCQLGHDLLNLD
jgi:hypothetical protein